MTDAPPPSRDRIGGVLREAWEFCEGQREGKVADYIPALAGVDPVSFGIALATADGGLHCVGDTATEFTIQSISKALAFCLALELQGREEVLRHVGVEPSGDAFNGILFHPRSNRPFNPMVNAGAIAISGLIRDAAGDDGFGLLLDRFSKAAGRPLSLSRPVLDSEVETGHRNRAIGHLLLNAGALRAPVDAALDLYFRQCSVLVNAADLARIGATLANIGSNPVTGEQVFDVHAVRDTLAVMFTCGMYDYAGNWALDIGIPAKSGVGGGILGVVNRQLGLGTYSPRLDANGNSVRGIAAMARLSDDLGLHAFECTNFGSQGLASRL
jgi:glutaminase